MSTLAAGAVAVLLLAPATASHLPALAWRIEPVDVLARAVLPVSIAVDATGALHIGYANGPDTVYAKQEMGLWVTKFTAQGGGAASVAIGPTGTVHLAFGRGQARYATNQTGEWVEETLPAGVGYDNDIAVDPFLRVHIVTSHSGSGLTYALRDASGWHTDTISLTAMRSSIAVDSQGQPHVVFSVTAPDRLVYMIKSASGWQSHVLASFWGASPDIAIDANDGIHVAYNNEFGRQLFYAHNDGTRWTTTVAATSAGGLLETALAVDSQANPHVVYSERLCFCILEAAAGHPWYVARNDDGSWSQSIIDPDAKADDVAISIDDSRVPRVLYQVLWDQALETIRRPIVRYHLQYAEPLTELPSRVPRGLV